MPILKLIPSFKDYIWGGNKLVTDYNKKYDGKILAESWELSSHPDGVSVIGNGEFKGKNLIEYLEIKGNEVMGENCRRFTHFPILIKFIDAKDNLSIQVHPDNEYALKNENQYGKTEIWYVTDCKEGAFLYYGFAKQISKEEFSQRIQDNTLLEVLNKVYVKKGDVLFIEAGTIHAIGKDIVIAEIQQNSNITYRVYDYGRRDKDGNTRELHIEKALNVTKCVPIFHEKSVVPHLAKCDYFVVDKINLDGKVIGKISGKITNESFASILIVEGSGKISCGNETLEFIKGDSFLLPANSGDYQIEGFCEALVTTIDTKDDEVYITSEINDKIMNLALFDNEKKMIWNENFNANLYENIDHLIQKSCENLLEVLSKKSIKIDRCKAIGVAISGNISKDKISDELKKHIPIPVYVDNKSNVILKNLKEKEENSVLLDINDEIDSAVMLSNKIFPNGNNLGNVLCKNGATLENNIGKLELIKQTKNAMINNQDCYMWTVCDENLDNVDEFTALKSFKDDYIAKEILFNYVDKILDGIHNISYTFAPKEIIINAFFADYNEIILDILKQKLKENIKITALNLKPKEVLTQALNLI